MKGKPGRFVGVIDLALRRMFSLAVVDTDKFSDMPISCQALYFHLGLRGDDDGFVQSPRKIARSIGCVDGDLRVLAERGYIIPFQTGVIVISDWLLSNTLKNDRYKETNCLAEKSELAIKNGRYLLKNSDTSLGKPDCFQDVSKMVPNRNQNGSTSEPQLNSTERNVTKKVPLFSGAERVGKKTIDNSGFDEFWAAFPRRQGKQAAQRAWGKLAPNGDLQAAILKAVAEQAGTEQWMKDGGQFIPLPASWINGRRWEDETPAAVSARQDDDLYNLEKVFGMEERS